MNTKLVVLLVGIGCAMPLQTFGQVVSGVTFTRITTGAIVTDAAHSFGCAWGDYDGDGFLDLMVGNGLGDANALYHNNGDGTFTRVTNVITTTVGDTDGVVWGDYDNDGDLDLFAANYQVASFLFRNEGNGVFNRIITGSMVENVADSVGCSWGDYDNDGFLDLIVANEGTVQNPYLYQNGRDGTFTQVFDGLVSSSGGQKSDTLWADYDNDGRLDLILFAATSSSQTWLFHNQGDGIFSVGPSPPMGPSVGGNGDWGDYDNDGDLDLVIAQAGAPPGANELQYRNNGDGTFTQIFDGPIPNSGGHSGLCTWGDYDNDGWLDLWVNNSFGQTGFLFHNNGDGTFTRIIDGDLVNVGGDHKYGCAWGDYDNDGFLDLFITRGGADAPETNLLYHNDGNSNRWLSVVCVGRISNRSGIGAKVRVRAVIGGVTRWQLRDISSGTGYTSSRLRAHFGLGDATNAEIVRIEWPSGVVQELRDVPANRIFTVKEPPVLAFIGKSEGADGKVSVATLSLKGGQGISYAVERSTNLVHWDYLTNVVATNIVTYFMDGPRLFDDLRFYRAREDD